MLGVKKAISVESSKTGEKGNSGPENVIKGEKAENLIHGNFPYFNKELMNYNLKLITIKYN